jgi:hypothetical protein
LAAAAPAAKLGLAEMRSRVDSAATLIALRTGISFGAP